MSRRLNVLALAFALLIGGCAVEKSSNPLSPSVAGPIPGVEIAVPKLIQPPNFQRFAFDQQPVALTVANAESSGVRPLTYRFEVAADVAFTNVLYTREGVEPGPSGQTSHRLTDALEPERSYFWRARAEDGANAGAFSPAGTFYIFSPLVLRAPTPVSPINDAIVSTLRPPVVFRNADRTGPPAAIIYNVEASDSVGFINSQTVSIEEQPGQTSLIPPADLPPSRQIFWRVRATASDPATVGPWSATQVFRTPAPAPVPTPTPTPTPGPAPGDELDLGTVTILKGPGGIVNWPVGSRITGTSQGGGELCIWHEQLGRWPAVIFFGDPNTLVEGNQWVFANIGGRWYGGAADWYRPGQACKGVDANSIGRDAFDQEPLHSWVPRPGEVFGLMSSTPARAWPDMRTLDQRTNIVLLRWQ